MITMPVPTSRQASRAARPPSPERPGRTPRAGPVAPEGRDPVPACCTDAVDSAAEATDLRSLFLCLWTPSLAFKLNHDRCHHIPRRRHRVTNSAAYDAALRQRGSLTVWFTGEAIEGWRAAPRTTPGGQPCYSSLTILAALTVRAVFRLALRQTEGLIGSIISLLGHCVGWVGVAGAWRPPLFQDRATRT
jgi:hypothetical protein